MPKAIKGKTDLWTTRPDVASMLVDKKLGYTIMQGSHKSSDFICPNCGAIVKNRVISTVCKNGLKCPVCYDGISYPEKFMSCVFDELGISPIRDSVIYWSEKKRYDFYVEEFSLIVETHGMQHYSRRHGFHVSNKRDEKSNDAYKKNLAIKNGIKHYIELDCRLSNFDYIKNSVMHSELIDLFDMSVVNWDNVKIGSLKSIIIEACNLYNSGISSANQIAQILKIDNSTAIDYLHKGTGVGLCNYNFTREKQIICIETKKTYFSLMSVEEDGFNMSQVSACCHHKAITAGGCHWCFLDEYDNYKILEPANYSCGKTKRVICIEDNKIYKRLEDVRKDGYNPTNVSQVCNGRRNTHRHKHFKFID